MNLDTLIVSIAALLPLLGSFLIATAFFIAARRVWCRHKKWSDVRDYIGAHLDSAFSVLVFGYFFTVRVIIGQTPPETFQSFIGSFLVGCYFLFNALGQLNQRNDRWGVLGKGRQPIRSTRATHAGD